jgi:IS4 transposase
MKEKLRVKTGVSVSELLNLIDQQYLSELAAELEADKWVLKIKAKTVFNLLLYSLLESDKVSLRGMQDNYSAALFRAIEGLTLQATTAHSSIRDRLTQIDVTYFERIYEQVYQQLGQHYDQPALSRYNIKRYDSTMIHVFGHVMQGMKVGNSSKNKFQVKLTTELTNSFGVRMRFFSDQGHLSEETALRELIEESQHQPDDLVVFDRGLKSRATFRDLSQGGVQFVTRLNLTARYLLRRPHQPLPYVQHDDIEVLGDDVVYLYGDRGRLVEHEFRLVRVRRKQDGQELLFLTTLLDVSAYLVAYIYRQRWKIEVFFRFMKQQMNLTHFVSHNANAIQVMLYCSLIAAMLILVYKKTNQIRFYKSAKIQFFKELQAAVILEVLELPGGVDLLKQYLTQEVRRQ